MHIISILEPYEPWSLSFVVLFLLLFRTLPSDRFLSNETVGGN